MKPPKPLPTEPPFITFYTCTHLRPAGLARNLASVGRQTAVDRIEQLVFPDHAGYGLVGGLFGRVPWYAGACRGRYVAFLSDDDELAGEKVVEGLERFVERRGEPPAAILVRVMKGGLEFPRNLGAPVEGDVDLGSYVLRRDIWLKYQHAYGQRYAGDFDHALAMWNDGVQPVYWGEQLWAIGPMSTGRPEISL